jgi:hypothetical protein
MLLSFVLISYRGVVYAQSGILSITKLENISADSIFNTAREQLGFSTTYKQWFSSCIDTTKKAEYKKKIPLRLGWHPTAMSYAATFMERVDTPFFEKNIVYQNLNFEGNVQLGGLPFSMQLNYYHTNSFFQNDKLYFHVNFDKTALLGSYFTERLGTAKNCMQNNLQNIEERFARFKKLQLTDPTNSFAQIRDFKQMIAQPQAYIDRLVDTGVVLQKKMQLIEDAKQYVQVYDSLYTIYENYKKLGTQYQKLVDSISNKIQEINYYTDAIKNGSLDHTKLLRLVTNKYLGTRQSKLMDFYKRIQSIQIGSISNTHTALLQNVQMNGFSVSYGSKSFVALTAGIHRHLNDIYYLVSNRTRATNNHKDYSITAALGHKYANDGIVKLNVQYGRMFTPFNQAKSIGGISLYQYQPIGKHSFIAAEVGHSFFYNDVYNTNINKTNPLRNINSKFITVKAKYTLPQLHTSITGDVRFTGENVSLNTNRLNPGKNIIWRVQLQQQLWKGKIRLNGYIRNYQTINNQFNYQINTIEKSATLTAKLKKASIVSINYFPFTQWISFANINRKYDYQVANLNWTHNYKFFGFPHTVFVGISDLSPAQKAQKDSFDISYRNFYLKQYMYLPRFTAFFGVQSNVNQTVAYAIVEGGLTFSLFKRFYIDVIGQAYNLNKKETKLGYQCSVRFLATHKWTFAGSIQQMYLPKIGADFEKIGNGFLNATYRWQ